MNNRKIKEWPIIAGIIFAGVVFATMGLIVEVVGLDMLPVKYLGLASKPLRALRLSFSRIGSLSIYNIASYFFISSF